MPAYRINSQKIIQTVYETIGRQGMLRGGDSVLVGVSGGPDSIALLHILIELTPGLSLRLGVAHLNHGLRGSGSDAEAEFVLSVSKKLNLPCYIEKADVRSYRDRKGLSLEEAARRIRYRFFSKTAERNGYEKIALGHHDDDNAELILMVLLRGSGPLGLAGIPPVRGRAIVRPLMGLTRSRIIAYLTENGIPYVSDPSNTDNRFARNRIRNRLIPELKKNYNPKIVETLNRQASIFRDEEEWIETIVQSLFDQVATSLENDNVSISTRDIERLPPGARRRIIRKAVARAKGNLRGITFSHVEAAMQLTEKGPKYGSIDLPGKVRITRADDRVFFAKGKIGPGRPARPMPGIEPLHFLYTVSSPGTWHIKEIDAYMRFSETERITLPPSAVPGASIALFDRDRVSFPFVVRNVRPGDRFRPLGVGGAQKVKKYFVDNKVNRDRRANCPVLLCDDRIIWLAGHRLDESAKLPPGARNVLKVELLLA